MSQDTKNEVETKCRCNYCRIVIKKTAEKALDELTCAKCGRSYMETTEHVEGVLTKKWVCTKEARRAKPGNSAAFTPAGTREWSRPEIKAFCDVSKANDWKVVADVSQAYGYGVLSLRSNSLGREILVRKAHVRVRDPKMFWRTDKA